MENKLYIQHAFVSAIAVFIAVLVNQKIAFSKEYWIILAAFFTSQTTVGTPLKQGFLFTAVMVVAILLGTTIIVVFSQAIIANSIVALIFILASYYARINRLQVNRSYFLLLIFAIVLILIALMPDNIHGTVRNRIIDIIIGSGIGIACAQIIFPVKIEQAFRQGVIPILENLSDYSNMLTKGFLDNVVPKAELFEKKIRIYRRFLQNYPEWVYEIGFNPGLRSGLRFFLLKLEEVTDILFSMNYLSTINNIDSDIMHELKHFILTAMNKNQELLGILIKYFSQEGVLDIRSDFVSDITNLENALHHVVPDNLELLNFSRSNIILTALVRDIKDMRIALLSLIQALPVGLH